jgi:hypothetical protein
VQWLTPIILATWEAEMREGIVAQGQPGLKVSKTPFQPIAGHGGVQMSSQQRRKHK